MIYITGDTHGEVSRFQEIQEQYRLNENDMLIVAGDFGCIFGLGKQDQNKLDVVAKLPYTIAFLDGNHECFPQIFSCPEEMWNGGRVHRIRPNMPNGSGMICPFCRKRGSTWSATPPASNSTFCAA